MFVEILLEPWIVLYQLQHNFTSIIILNKCVTEKTNAHDTIGMNNDVAISSSLIWVISDRLAHRWIFKRKCSGAPQSHCSSALLCSVSLSLFLLCISFHSLLAEEYMRMGYTEDDVRAILTKNFFMQSPKCAAYSPYYLALNLFSLRMTNNNFAQNG